MRKASVFVLVLGLAGCGDGDSSSPATPAGSDGGVNVGSPLPADYFTLPEAPPPPPVPETAVVERVVDLGPPEVPVVPEPAPPPPPPPPVPRGPSPDELARMERERLAAERLVKRRAQGPSFLHAQTVAFPPLPPEWKVTDKNYDREAPPTLESSLPVDRSRLLTMERRIPAVLIDSLNTQLPGKVQALVTQDVFGADGRLKLIARGDILMGDYESLEKLGETRVNVTFNRIMRQGDGALIYGGADAFGYAADKMGRTGLIGELDTRFWDKYGTAFLTAAVGAAAGAAAQSSEGTEGIGGSLGERLAEQFGVITAKVLEQNIDLAPVVTVAQGEEFIVQLTHDIQLREPAIVE